MKKNVLEWVRKRIKYVGCPIPKICGREKGGSVKKTCMGTDKKYIGEKGGIKIHVKI